MADIGKIDPHVFSKGSKFPPQGQLGRLYSMRFCPFAHRARLVLAHKEIPYETVNIHLTQKPEWFVEKTPEGKVPVWVKDGDVVGDSLAVARHLDANFKDRPLFPKDSDDDFLTKFSKELVTNYYGVIKTNGEDPTVVSALMGGLQWLEDMLTRSGLQFFAGREVGYVDLMVWPFHERLPTLEKYIKMSTLLMQYPLLSQWTARMKELPAVQTCAQTDEMHSQYISQWQSGADNPFDLGL